MLYQVEKVEAVYHELIALAMLSHNELRLDEMFGEVVLNKESYEELEKQEALLIVTARINKELIGYAVYFIAHSIFNKKKQAESHSFYMKKNYRKGYNGLNLLYYAEKELKKKDVEIVLQKVNLKCDVSLVFERMQYKQIEKVFAKEL